MSYVPISARRGSDGKMNDRPLFGMVQAAHEYEGGSDASWYWTRGHVDKQAFIDEIKHYYQGLSDEPYPVEEVKHTYFRNVPVGEDSPGEMVMYVARAGRGAYPVTMIDIDMVAYHDMMRHSVKG